MPSIYDLFDRTPDEPPPEPPRRYNGADTAYSLAALRSECDELAALPPDSRRNQKLNEAAFNMGRHIGGGQIRAHTVIEQLTAAARHAGLRQSEIDTCLRPDQPDAGINRGQQHPRVPPPRDPLWDANGTPPPGEDKPTAEDDDPPAADPPPPPGPSYAQRLLNQEINQQRARREARRLLDAEEALTQFREPPHCPTLTAELLIPDQAVRYTVEQILPVGGNALLTAQFKAGKTTFVNQLARALADHTPFLDHFPVAPSGGRVALFNYEVDRQQYRRWLRDVSIADTDRVVPLNLRGYRLPLHVQHVEDWIVRWLAEQQISTWIVDPFARAFTGGLSENDNAEVGRFLDTLDVIKTRAGVSELILPVHTGRAAAEDGQEHARGATRLDDWADVRWFLTRDDNDTRYFRATGRDVEVAEQKLTYLEKDRSLIFGGGDRKWEKNRRTEDAVIAAVNAEPGISLSGLRAALRDSFGRIDNEVVDAGIRAAEAHHQIRIEHATKGLATKHFPTGGGLL